MDTFSGEITAILLDVGVVRSANDIQEINFFPRTGADLAYRVVAAGELNRHRGTLGGSLVEDIQIAGNYINVTLSLRATVKWLLPRILSARSQYGLESVSAPISVAVEHTSLTPVYPINLATFRSSAIGNAIASLLSLSGLSVEPCFWVEDMCRQLDLVQEGVAALHLSVERLGRMPGKPDHNIGVIFAATLHRRRRLPWPYLRESISRMFPLSGFFPIFGPQHEFSSAETSTVGEEPQRPRLCGLSIAGYEETFRLCGINVEKYDFETEVFASPRDQLAALDTNGIRNESDSEVADTSSYYARNVAYFAYKLSRFDRVISVVPLQQRDLLELAAEKATELCRSTSSDRFRLVFYGDVLAAQGTRDSITSGVFNSVDGFVAKHATELGLPAGVIAGSLTFLMLRTRAATPVRLDLPPRTLHRDFLRIVGVLEAIADGNSDRGRSWADDPNGTHLERTLVKHLLFYPSLVERVRRDLEFHVLASFAVALADLMWRYGQPTRIQAAGSKPCRPLMEAGNIVLRSALSALGISV